MKLQKGTSTFKPKAGLISVLGEQLIKDAGVGIIELVKNGYDADATKVMVTMISLNNENGMIEIFDNGFGMDIDTFLNRWMNPASFHKAQQKKNSIRSVKGRLPLGEKGVGRFAAQKISNNLKMITKVKKSNKELHVYIDWSKFSDTEKYLSEINIKYEEKECEYFKVNESGTLLRMFDLKDAFSESDIKKLSTILRRLKSPFKGAKDFNIELIFEECLPEFSKYSNLEISDILEKANYKITGIIDENGIFDYTYEFNHPDKPNKNDEDKFDLSQFANIKKLRRPFNCGGFIVNLYNYDRSPETINTNKINTKELDEVCGVSVYRDGIRIFPYGERGDDWLGLDKRRIQNPTKYIDNNTIIGWIEINQKENKLLIDKTNREGLIENSAYEQFKELVLGSVMFLEEIRLDDKPKKIKKTKQNKLNSKEDIKNDIDELKEGLCKVLETLNQNKQGDKKSKEIVKTLGEKVIEIEEDVLGKIEEDEKAKDILLNLAGTGLAAERFTHEFEMLVKGIMDAFKKLALLIDMKSNPKIKDIYSKIAIGLDALRNDILLLGPLFYLKKSTKEKEISINYIIKTVIDLQSRWLIQNNIKYDIAGNNFSVVMREGLCAQIFNNLLDNSVYWLSQKSESDEKQVKFLLDDRNKTVYVTDSGPGITQKFKNKIFDMFFSMKGETGRGLGLWIVKEILNEKKFSIQVVDKDEHKGLLNGASFKINFN